MSSFFLEEVLEVPGQDEARQSWAGQEGTDQEKDHAVWHRTGHGRVEQDKTTQGGMRQIRVQ